MLRFFSVVIFGNPHTRRTRRCAPHSYRTHLISPLLSLAQATVYTSAQFPGSS